MNCNGLSFEFGQAQFDRMVPRCDLCLTVSGTATLHVAGFGIPMIVVYHINPLAWNAVGRWLVPTRTFALVNVLFSHVDPNRGHIVPELVPWNGPDSLANLALELLHHPQKLEALPPRSRPADRPARSSRGIAKRGKACACDDEAGTFAPIACAALLIL